MASEVLFERIEKKYLMSKKQYSGFLKCMEPYMQIDEFGDHTVMSLYYDTEHWDLIRRSIEKPVFKEKLRLRSYGTPGETDPVYIELKRKYHGVVYKRRREMTLTEARKLLSEGVPAEETDQVLREIGYFLDFYRPLTPHMLISCERAAYYSKSGPKIRLTIDRNIRARETELDLAKGDGGTLLFPDERFLMELKIEGSMPLWIAKALSELKLYPGGFSKYGRFYMKKMKEETENV